MLKFSPRRSFGTRLGLAIATIILFFFLLLSWIVSSWTKTKITIDRGEFMEHLAYQMAEELDKGMYVYFEQIERLATLEAIRDPNQERDSKRGLLEKLQRSYNEYAWIGLTDSKGNVLVSTDKIIEGKNVAARPWFTESRDKSTVQDVHGAKLLATLVPNPSLTGDPIRFVDVASPVFNSNNEFVGVLGAHLYWQWAAELRNNLLEPLENIRHVEVLILSASGEILLAPSSDHTITDYSSPELNLKNLDSFRLAQQGKNDYVIETWLNKQSYLTGYAPTNGHKSYPGLGWVVLVRQPANEAFAAAITLQQQIMAWGIFMGFVSGGVAWKIAERIIKPMLEIASAADRIRNGDRLVEIPIIGGVDEVAMLSKAVFRMYITLVEQNSLLASFNEELEQKVLARTNELNQANEKLSSEIEERKQAQIALQKANEELKQLNMLDGLTGIANRRCFDNTLNKEWLSSARLEQYLSLILIDIDYFKRYNDFYGHQAGDRCLQQVALALSRAVKRPRDLVARYGGEEFVVILPHTDTKGAAFIAETIRETLKDFKIPHAASEVSQYVTLSIGIATLIPEANAAPSSLIEMADKKLYQAKTQGRDRAVYN